MNFIRAIQHTALGYGIRRKEWRDNPDCYLCLQGGNLVWSYNFVKRLQDNGHKRLIPKLLGPDFDVDIQEQDIRAEDWELQSPAG